MIGRNQGFFGRMAVRIQPIGGVGGVVNLLITLVKGMERDQKEVPA